MLNPRMEKVGFLQLEVTKIVVPNVEKIRFSCLILNQILNLWRAQNSACYADSGSQHDENSN